MAASEWYHQKMAIVGTVDATSAGTAGTVWTDAVDHDVFERAIYIVHCNQVSANTTLTLTVYSDDASATGGMTNAIATSTSLTNANDDSQMWVEVDTEDFNVDGRLSAGRVARLTTMVASCWVPTRAITRPATMTWPPWRRSPTASIQQGRGAPASRPGKDRPCYHVGPC